MKTFSVIKPGPLTTIQDAGRIGQNRLGLTEGGPMDYRSFALANRLVGNDINAAALEVTLGGLTLKCLSQTSISLTGAFCPLSINGKPAQLWKSHLVKSDDIIEIGFAALGARSYLATSGGFDGPVWFSSQATVIREGLGTALAKEDVLESQPSNIQNFKLDYKHQPSLRKQAALQFVPGYQWHQISTESQQVFLTNPYKVSPRNDRMGYQLAGQTIHTGIESIYSEGISRGAIQIPGDGQPIVLMKDRQTIGGYPKLGSVITQDLDTLAQLTVGTSVSFQQVTPEYALEQFRSYIQEISDCELLQP